MLTIFSTPRPFTGLVGMNQHNALSSWQRITQDVILFDCDEGDAQDARVCNDIRKSEGGTPYIGDMFDKAQELAQGNIMVYTNADILFTTALIHAAHIVRQALDTFVGIGQRTDVDIMEPISFGDDGTWEKTIEKISARGQLHDVCGMDYIIFTKPLKIDWIPILVGRPAWDVWTIRQVLNQRIPLVNLTHDVMAVHANHGPRQYEYGENENALALAEAEHNRKLTQHIKHAYITHANYRLIDGKVIKR